MGVGVGQARGETIDIGVLTVTVALLVVLVARRVLVLARSDDLSRRSALVTLGLAVALLAAAAVPEARHHWVQARASTVVVQVSGVPGASARCQRFSADLFDVSAQSGFVSYGGDVAQLRRTVCNDLAAWLLSDKDSPTGGQVRALHIVVHEAMHVAGEFDESKAECLAMQRDAAAAELLGASPEQARALALAYYTDVYPWLRDGYTSPSCAPDGADDLSPGDGQFP